MTNWLHCVAVRFGLGPETEQDGTGRKGSKQKTVASREMESGRTLERLLCIHAKLIDHNQKRIGTLYRLKVLELAANNKRLSTLTIPSFGSITIFFSICCGSDE